MADEWIGLNHLLKGAIYGDSKTLSRGILYNSTRHLYALSGDPKLYTSLEIAEHPSLVIFSLTEELNWISEAPRLYDVDIEYAAGLMAIPSVANLSQAINHTNLFDTLKDQLKDVIYDKVSDYPAEELKRKLPVLQENGLALFSDNVYTVMNSRNEAVHFDTKGKKLEGEIAITPASSQTQHKNPKTK